MIKTTTDIRKAFLDFFCNKGHKKIEGSSLISKNNPSLLFTNAGMNQFSNIFLGIEKSPFSRITTCQPCVRISGKHNDLENIGNSTNHNTFFEMLGNFSFGDYFKKEAINFAWELLTDKKWFSLPKDKLFVSVYYTDNETYDIWKNDIKLPKEHIIIIGDNPGKLFSSDNFWQMGDTGPCGPCTEIFFCKNNEMISSNIQLNDNFIEIWNLVFIEFNRKIDGSFVPLKDKSVDTGMGLERIAKILQNVNSNYQIDIFKKLITNILQIIGDIDTNNRSLFIIADHIRSCSFLIFDGVIPSNEGTGYVLRRLIRRSVVHGYLLGIKNIFFYELVDSLIYVMDFYDKLIYQKDYIKTILLTEEKKFFLTLEKGIYLLNQYFKKLNSNTLDGKIAFLLYDTYGFPLDLTIEICNLHKIKVDTIRFKHEMEIQKCRSKKFSNFNIQNTLVNISTPTLFIGYHHFESYSKIIALFQNNKSVNSIYDHEESIVILDKTPFYGESGGQIGDIGIIKNDKFIFNVTNTKKFNNIFGHIGKLSYGQLTLGQNVYAKIFKLRRNDISINHTATHLLHSALRKVLGNHITQRGSFINDEYLRFDFSHHSPLSEEKLFLIEKIVNKQILFNQFIQTSILDSHEAILKTKIISLFHPKSQSKVRLLIINDFSTELCGGTHTTQTGNIGLFNISSESGISSGIRRIDAITGQKALIFFQHIKYKFKKILNITNFHEFHLVENILNLKNKYNLLLQKINYINLYQIRKKYKYLINNITHINGINFLIHEFNNIDFKILRSIIIDLKPKLHSSIIILASIENNSIFIIVKVTKDINQLIKANEIINYFSLQIKGGGNHEIAQAVGINNYKLSNELNNIKKIIYQKLLFKNFS